VPDDAARLLADGGAVLLLWAVGSMLATEKRLGPVAAAVPAAAWIGGGAVGALLLDGIGAAGSARVLFALTATLMLWSRPDRLPERVRDGRREVCVYRAPGALSPDAVGAYLADAGLDVVNDAWAVWVVVEDAPRARQLLPRFVAPVLVHRGRSVTDAHLVADWLRRNDIPAQVRGVERNAAAGGIPIHDSWPDVWVRGADRERAEVAMKALYTGSDGAAWRCPACGEECPSGFGSCWKCGASND
jgi:hypothetical protein